MSNHKDKLSGRLALIIRSNSIPDSDKIKKDTKYPETSLFLDINDYTKSFIRRDSYEGEIALFLKDYFEAMDETIELTEGKIDKFIGDAILAIFPSPIKAFWAACLMIRETWGIHEHYQQVLALKEDYKPWYSEGIFISIGIESGHPIHREVCEIHSGERHDILVSSSINISNRLCSSAKRNEIAVGKNAYDFLKDFVDNQIFSEEKEGIAKEQEYQYRSVDTKAMDLWDR